LIEEWWKIHTQNYQLPAARCFKQVVVPVMPGTCLPTWEHQSSRMRMDSLAGQHFSIIQVTGGLNSFFFL